MTPPLISASPFPLIKSLFFIPPSVSSFCWSAHTLRPTVARGPIHEAKRRRKGKHKELPTQWRGLWAQRWPLKDVCGLHPDAVALPTGGPGSSPPLGLDLSLNLRDSQNNLKTRLATVNSGRRRVTTGWHEVWMVIELCQQKKNNSEESLPC